MDFAGVDCLEVEPIGGGDICTAFHAVTSVGRDVFVKTRRDAPAGFFEAEARGLRRLRVAGAPPTPDVIAVCADALVLEWVVRREPTRDSAVHLGGALAQLHRATADLFGADEPGFVGRLPLDNTRSGEWATFYAERRLSPYTDALDRRGRAAIGALCDRLPTLAGPEEPPALLHGDLWSGNILWADGTVPYLVDAAAAHYGHRETDLAMLALFGAPFLDDIVAAYERTASLAAGWRERVGLHQLHPLLVHAAMFGAAYAERATAVAEQLLTP